MGWSSLCCGKSCKNNGKKVIEVFNRSNREKTSKEFDNFDDDIIGGELITAYKVTH